jgi:hypothetical protein
VTPAELADGHGEEEVTYWEDEQNASVAPVAARRPAVIG